MSPRPGWPDRVMLCALHAPIMRPHKVVPEVLDACCPYVVQRESAILAKRGYSLVVCDIAPRTPAVVKADLRSLPFESGRFAGIISSDTLEHVDGWDAAVSELRRVLRPGGWFILHLPVPTLSTGEKREATVYHRTPTRHGHTMSPGMDSRKEVERFGFACLAEMKIFDPSKIRGGALWIFQRDG